MSVLETWATSWEAFLFADFYLSEVKPPAPVAPAAAAAAAAAPAPAATTKGAAKEQMINPFDVQGGVDEDGKEIGM